jgi:hypothetical protein
MWQIRIVIMQYATALPRLWPWDQFRRRKRSVSRRSSTCPPSLQFIRNPEGLLQDPDYNSGGAKMISRSRDLAASNPAAFNVIFG